MSNKKTGGLWRKRGRGGKYLIQRRDGSIPKWPAFVIGAKDPAAPAGLRAYADEAEKLGYDPRYVEDVRVTATEFEEYRKIHGDGNPDGVQDIEDDPEIVAKIKEGGSM